jgi:hypothetical protein
MSEIVGASTFHNRKGLSGLYTDSFAFTFTLLILLDDVSGKFSDSNQVS